MPTLRQEIFSELRNANYTGEPTVEDVVKVIHRYFQQKNGTGDIDGVQWWVIIKNLAERRGLDFQEAIVEKFIEFGLSGR